MNVLRQIRIFDRASAKGAARRRAAGLSPQAQLRLKRAAEALLVAGVLWCVFILVKMIATPLPVVPAAAPARVAAEVRASVGPIDPFRLADAPAAPDAQQSGEGLVDTTANLKLYGTWLDDKGGMAIIGAADAAQGRAFPGDTIAPGVTLESIHRDHVVIVRSGVREALRLLRTPPATKAIRGPQAAAPTPGAAMVSVPHGMRAVDNGSNGFNLVVEGGEPQLLDALGLNPGDVIVAIEGRPVPSDLQAFLPRLTSLPTARANIIRRGEAMTLELEVGALARLASTAQIAAIAAAAAETE